MASHDKDAPDSAFNSNLFFQLDDDTKNIKDLVFGCRAILIDEIFWNIIRQELINLMKEAGPLMLYQLGLSYGFRVGAQGRGKTRSVRDAIAFLEYYGLAAGWGKFKTVRLEMTNGRIDDAQVQIHDNFFAQGRNKTGNPQCFFLSGMLAGIAEGLIGEGHNCVETSCISCGATCCEFNITRIDPE